ncbi:MAG: FHA domain-containing protein [Propionicimonas sp.]|uniref:FHA domain-containing protein n=1 Tax=Propionicimonas sp. TaxID=1955623 RepID=UPI002B1FC94B|nr:FHA domain-containing protein [Propionicimonas sp.]MEA4944162.1 FHA domain-containing protein [Propionicimonas sp.]MEA5054161.1 FHA domain-containing protein [Propionicimonas sp.]
MPRCPAGHTSVATDFCDTCGLPIPNDAPTTEPTGSPAAPEPLQPPAPLVCPNCGTPNVPDALFCEACGNDFLGGSPAASPVEAAADGIWDAEPTASPSEPVEAGIPPADPAATGIPAAPLGSTPVPPPAQPATPPSQPTPANPVVDWVAELWIDPDWYASQGSTDPLPSPGLPDIVPLVKQTNLIGRVSRSRNIYPEIDCELDTGTSRRHARLSTDGSRWWIEDLESANGTFVGSASGPLPAMPIPRGRTELGPDARIYVGAWTRIVVRRATTDEREAYAG